MKVDKIFFTGKFEKRLFFIYLQNKHSLKFNSLHADFLRNFQHRY